MDEFKASNGATVSRDIAGGVKATPPAGAIIWLPSMSATALREFFQHERDKELGRWRWPENPEYVVYRKPGADDEDGRAALVLDERTGVAPRRWERGFDSGVFGQAARAYFDAHPEPKPWHNALPGEVWVITTAESEEIAVRACIQNEKPTFEYIANVATKIGVTDEQITSGRRIWPESPHGDT